MLGKEYDEYYIGAMVSYLRQREARIVDYFNSSRARDNERGRAAYAFLRWVLPIVWDYFESTMIFHSRMLEKHDFQENFDFEVSLPPSPNST